MKMTKLFTVLFVLFTASLSAQDKINLVIFSEDGDAFFAYVNGIRQNDKYETNVKVTGVSPNVSLRIEFENKAYPQLKKSSYYEPGMEHTVRIKRDTKSVVKLTYFGQTTLAESQNTGATTIAYHAAENPINSGASSNTNSQQNQTNTSINTNGYNTNVSIGGTTVMSTTTTSTGSDNVNMNINMGGIGINMNVNGNMPVTQQQTVTSTTVTTRGSATLSEGNGSSTNQKNNQVSASSNTSVKAGCAAPMSAASFAKMKQNVESKPFSDTKMSTAKIATKNGCLSVDQVKEICQLFSMDEDKLSYAKYAYDYCVEKANYYEVSEVFSFSSTTDEFNKFLEK
jgi:hypothetical protein